MRQGWVRRIGAVAVAVVLATAVAASELPCPAAKVAGGDRHALLLRDDGSLWVWGSNDVGQCGLGAAPDALRPTRLEGLPPVTDIACGEAFSLVACSDGSAWTFGANDSGQLGDGSATPSSTPIPVPSLTDVVAVACGARHSLALLADGSVRAWGRNESGQLGDGTTDFQLSAVAVQGLPGVVAIAAGGYTSFAVGQGGGAWGWGAGSQGQLGNGLASRSGVPVEVTGMSGVRSLAAGLEFALAACADGTAWAWGANTNGQLGDGTQVRSLVPVQVAGLAGARVVGASLSTSFAVLEDGSLHGWGDNRAGQVGDDSLPAVVVQPARIPMAEEAAGVASCSLATMSIDVHGSPWAWGDNQAGLLGIGWSGGVAGVGEVTGLTSVRSVAMAGSHALALRADGSAWSWGGALGQLGDASLGARSRALPVPRLTGVVAIAAGGASSAGVAPAHSLALMNDGSIVAWGANEVGQLGTGTTDPSAVPVAVLGLFGVTSVAAGVSHSLAVTSDGCAWAWGSDSRGQLGLGDCGCDWASAPRPVSGLNGAASVAAGNVHSLALMQDGTARAWGANASGQLGDGTSADAPAPVTVLGLSGVSMLAGGDAHSLALLSDGSTWAWGANGSGQLGTGNTLSSSVPVRVQGLPTARFVAASAGQSLAVDRDGSVWAWGENRDGLFGSTTPARSLVPLRVPGLAGITGLAAAATCRAAIWNDDAVLTWGRDRDGQLGHAHRPPARIPLEISCGCAGDLDGDALPDLWEQGPVDVNADGVVDIDLRALGADPMHRDLFVEIDAMQGRAPSPDALAAVVAAFAAAPNGLVLNPDGRDGVDVHFVVDECDLPLQPWPRNAWPLFDAVRAAHYGTPGERADPNWFAMQQAKESVFRYAVFADSYVGPDAELTRSGAAEVPGDDLFVTLGAWPVPGGTVEQQAGTLMHELGHLLGLLHRGDDDRAGAPNYHSVMNPSWQVPIAGLEASWMLDYSRAAWPALDETALDEAAGVGGHAGHLVPVGPAATDGARLVPERGPVDWNQDGDASDSGAVADVDDVDAARPPSPGLFVDGFEDWSALQYQLCGSLNYGIGKHPGTTIDHEIPLQRVQALSRIAVDCDRDGVPDADEIASGAEADCDSSGVPDACEIAAGLVADLDGSGVPDSCECAEPVPADVPSLRATRAALGALLEWSSAAPLHDLVLGDLSVLLTSRDWAAATSACTLRATAAASLAWTSPPAASPAAFALVRGRSCAGAGSWDSGSPMQAGSRDAGLSATCP